MKWNLQLPSQNRLADFFDSCVLQLVLIVVIAGLCGYSVVVTKENQELRRSLKQCEATSTRASMETQKLLAELDVVKFKYVKALTRLVDASQEIDFWKAEAVKWEETFHHAAPVEVTAYTLKSRTASGETPSPGTVAVSQDLFKAGWTFGKTVYIRNMGMYTIKDVMPSQWSKRLDVWVPHTSQAGEIGTKKTLAKLM